MRKILLALAAVGAIAAVTTSSALAVPVNGAAINQAADAARLIEDVHCRPYRHWHPWGYGYGCRRHVWYGYGYRHHHRHVFWRGHHGGFHGHHHGGMHVGHGGMRIGHGGHVGHGGHGGRHR